MAKKERPPLAGLNSDDDLERIRAYGLSRGFLPTDAAPPDPPAAAEQKRAPAVAAPQAPVIRPAPTRPWQAMFPDYLIEELRRAAAADGTAQKVVVMRALRAAGFRVDDIDLQDLRRR